MGVVTRVPPEFNWVSADARRNWFIGAPSSKGAKVPDSPHEVTVCLDGAEAGSYEDKFIYGQDHADLRAWGWSSVGSGGWNVGRWMMTTMEFSNGGPLKHDVSVYPYSELNNSILTGEVGMGSDGFIDQGGVSTRTSAMVHVSQQRAVLRKGRKDRRAAALQGRGDAGRGRGEGMAVCVV